MIRLAPVRRALLLAAMAAVCAHAEERDAHETPALSLLQDFATKLGQMVARKEAMTLNELRARLPAEKRSVVALVEPSARRLSAQEVYALCCDSVVIIGRRYKCPKCHNWHVSVASGFVLGREGAIVTNYHALDKEDQQSQGIAVGTRDGRVFAIQGILAASKAHDLVVLKVNAGDLRPLPLAGEAPVGAPVFCLSHPANHLYTLTQGIVSGYFQNPQGRDMAITADFAEGSSGAPILDETGAVVGIVRATEPIYYEEPESVGTRLQMVWKYCVPSTSLRALVSSPPR